MPDDGAAGVGSHHGLPRPVNAGTRYTPPLSVDEAASGPTSSAAVDDRPSPSRSHWIAAPVTKIAPSRRRQRRAVGQRPGHRGEHALGRLRAGGAHVEQHEAAGAVGVLGHARVRRRPARTTRPAGRRRCRRWGCPRAPAHVSDVRPKRPLDGITVGSACIGTPNRLAQLVAPRRACGCRTASCGWRWWVGGVHLAAGEVPHQPRVDGADRELVVDRDVAVLEQPLDLRAEKYGSSTRPVIGARAAARRRRRARRSERRCGGPATRWRCRTAWPVRAVPGQHGLALVGDADGRNGPAPDLVDDLEQGVADGLPDLLGVVLDPAGLGVVLGELAVGGHDGPVGPREDGSAAHTGGAGIDRDDATRCRGHVPTVEADAWRDASPLASLAVSASAAPVGGAPPVPAGGAGRLAPRRTRRAAAHLPGGAAPRSRPESASASCAGTRTWPAPRRAARTPAAHDSRRGLPADDRSRTRRAAPRPRRHVDQPVDGSAASTTGRDESHAMGFLHASTHRPSRGIAATDRAPSRRGETPVRGTMV
jgi:hypothetical protein